MDNIKLITVFILGLLTNCSDKQPLRVKTFYNPDPRKEAFQHTKIDSVYYFLDSSSFYSSERKIGDTLLLCIFDSLGNNSTTISYPSFRTTTNYYYDQNGDLQCKRISSDFTSEFYFASYIDTNKRVKYTKEPNLFGDPYLSQTFYNENGFPDSLITYSTNQRARVKYKEYFTYRNGKLLQSRKKVLEEYTKDADLSGTFLEEIITYSYINSKLEKITLTQLHPDKLTTKIIDYFDPNERPLFKELIPPKGYERLKARQNAP